MAGVAVDMGDQLSAQPLTHRTTDTSAGDTSLQWVDASQTRSCADETRSPLPSSGLGAEAEKQEYEAEHPVDVRQRLLRSVISLRATLESAWRGLRGWRDFTDATKFSIPSKLDALSRARVNLVYYRANYTVLMSLIAIWTVLSNLTFTIAMAVVAVLWKVYLEVSNRGAANVTLPGGTVLAPLQAFSLLSMGTLILFYVLGGSSTVFWLLTTVAIVILGHATLHEAAATQAELALDETSRAELDWV